MPFKENVVEENNRLLEQAEAAYRYNNKVMDKWQDTKRVLGISSESIEKVLLQYAHDPVVKKYLEADADTIDMGALIKEFAQTHGEDAGVTALLNQQDISTAQEPAPNNSVAHHAKGCLGEIQKKKGGNRIFL